MRRRRRKRRSRRRRRKRRRRSQHLQPSRPASARRRLRQRARCAACRSAVALSYYCMPALSALLLLGLEQARPPLSRVPSAAWLVLRVLLARAMLCAAMWGPGARAVMPALGDGQIPSSLSIGRERDVLHATVAVNLIGVAAISLDGVGCRSTGGCALHSHARDLFRAISASGMRSTLPWYRRSLPVARQRLGCAPSGSTLRAAPACDVSRLLQAAKKAKTTEADKVDARKLEAAAELLDDILKARPMRLAIRDALVYHACMRLLRRVLAMS